MNARPTRPRGCARTLLLLVAALALLAPPTAAGASASASTVAAAGDPGDYYLVTARLVDGEGQPVPGWKTDYRTFVPWGPPQSLLLSNEEWDRTSGFAYSTEGMLFTQDTDLGDLVLPPQRRLTFRVHDDNGRPIRNVHLESRWNPLPEAWLGTGWEFAPGIRQAGPYNNRWFINATTALDGTVTVDYPALKDDALLDIAPTIWSGGRPYTVRFDRAVRTGPDSYDVPVSGLRQPVSAPDAPTQPTAVSQDRAVRVSWRAPEFDGFSPITGYVVTTQPGGATTTVSGADTLSTVVTGLTGGTAYSFTVQAVNAIGSSQPSPVAGAVAGSIPTPVTAPRVRPGDRSANVQFAQSPLPPWDVRQARQYTVIAAPGGQTKVIPASGFRHDVTFKGLTNGTPYTFSVTATNDFGTSEASPSRVVTPAGRPLRVAKPRVVVKNRNVTVSWRKTGLNGGVLIRYDVHATGQRALAQKVFPGRKLSTTFRDVRPGRYIFRVSARTKAGSSPPGIGQSVVVR